MPRIEKKSFIQKNGLIAIWAMAGFIAMGYIGFLVVGVEPAANRARLAASLPAGHDQNLHNQVAALNAKIDRIKHNELKLAHKLNNIEQSLGPMTASINPAMGQQEVLLGMSFLKHLEFTQRGNTLTLRQYAQP